MVDVFISYSRADEDSVRRLAQKIEAEGYAVWWDAELPPHKSYGEVIEEKVRMAKAAIVVWSPTAAASEWVRAEADMARSEKKLIQTALGDIMPPLPFNQIQFADIGDWQGEDDHSGWRKVKASLAELCGRGELADGAPAAVAANPAAPVAPPPPPAPAPTPEPTSTPTPVQPLMGPPPGSLEAHRPKPGSTPKWPIFLGVGIGALGLIGGVAVVLDLPEDDYEEIDYAPVALADPVPTEATPEPFVTPTPTPTPTQTAAPPPVQPAAPSYPRGPQTFSGSLNQGQSRNYAVGLNANTSYMISAQCDQDCTDIDMWLYDENGNLIDEDTLDDDYPILEVSPIRSAEFQMRIQMFSCSIEPCGIEITVQPQ